VKKVLGVLGMVGLVSVAGTNLTAQTTGPQFGAQMEFGMKGSTGGAFNGSTKNNGAVGPYLRPQVSLDYSGTGFSTYAYYQLWLESGAKYGPDKNADFGNSITFMHYPFAGVAVDLPNQFKAKLDAEATYQTVSDASDQAANNLYFAALPAIERKLNDRFTVGAAYVFVREEGLDPITPTREEAIANIAKSIDEKAKGNQLSQIFNNLDPQEQQERLYNEMAFNAKPISSHQLGRAYVNTKLNDRFSLSTYVQGGQKYNNKGRSDTTEGRLHNELKAKVTANFAARLRHRLNARITDSDTRALTNQFRFIGEYQMGSNWGVYAESVLGIVSEKADGTSQPTAYSNTSYLGLVYGF
jgi:hypothetical protein